METKDIFQFKNKTILILNPQCYECTSIGYDDEPGGNCSDSQPGGKVVKNFTILVVAVITDFFVSWCRLLLKFHELNLIFIHRCDADQDILGASSANVRQLQSKTSTKLKALVSNRNVCV